VIKPAKPVHHPLHLHVCLVMKIIIIVHYKLIVASVKTLAIFRKILKFNVKVLKHI